MWEGVSFPEMIELNVIKNVLFFPNIVYWIYSGREGTLGCLCPNVSTTYYKSKEGVILFIIIKDVHEPLCFPYIYMGL